MKYNVAQLLKGAIGGTRHYLVERELVSNVNPDALEAISVSGQIHFLRTRAGILVTGQVHATVTVPCSRCLEPTSVELIATIEEEFKPTIDILTGGKLAVEEEDRALLIDEHHILNMTEVIRQALALAWPMHPLCRPDCAGLCPECGHNLNEGPCGCTVDQVDPRWAALRALILT